MSLKLIARLDALETYLLRLPDKSLELRHHQETVIQAKSGLQSAWNDLANPEVIYLKACSECGSDNLKCHDCGWWLNV